MAELAVATAVAKLTNLIIQEAILLTGVSEKVEQIRNELRWMQSFLKDADRAAEQDRNERFRNWVSQSREVAFDAQDVVETYLREAASQSLWKKVVMPILLHKVKRENEKIQSRIDHFSKQKDSFGISRDGGEGSISTIEKLRWWRQPLPHIEKDDLVDLVQDLKSCFLHLGLFPEDFFIPKTQLMRLWVAEGFLPEQGEDKTEGVAENCLNELINTCMIQVGTLTSLGRVKTIRIHDLLRDFSPSVSREENFLGIYTGHEVESSVSPSTKTRRIALHSNPTQHGFLHSPFLNPYASHLRSLHFLNDFQFPNDYFIKKDFKLLKVLDLNHTSGSTHTPSAIGILTELRFLGVSQILKNFCIPPSIGNLKNLETLDLGYSYSPIPYVIWKMKRLRHLLLCDKSRPNRVKLRLDTLSHLQTLKTIRAGRWIEDGGLANMISARRLGIERLSQERVNLVISILKRMCYLQSLSLEVMNNETFPTSMASLISNISTSCV